MKYKTRILIYTLLSAIFTAVFVNCFAHEINDFNAKIRTLLKDGQFSKKQFSEDGLPLQFGARVGAYRSPFYVVHYGLEYSEVCKPKVVGREPYHWLPDQTSSFWPSSPFDPSLVLFKNAANWIVENIEEDDQGNSHLLYDFDWPYKNYPNGGLKAPWWSGLTDGHAITLMLRAWDCFEEQKFLDAAEKLYLSTIRPVSDGGSLLYFNGHPWIEEYVDPRADVNKMSKVFNGMAYAYFGIKGFEEFHGIHGLSGTLRRSIVSNIHEFDLGYWSLYDAIGSRANLKYHNVNLALLKDNRLFEQEFEKYIREWSVGRLFPAVFFIVSGPKTFAYYHFIMTTLFIFSFILFVLFFLFGSKNEKK